MPRYFVTLIVAVALFMETMDSTVIATSLPAIAKDLGEDPIALKLALTSYLLSLAVFIPLSGWAADRYGARTVFRAAIVVFTLGSAPWLTLAGLVLIRWRGPGWRAVGLRKPSSVPRAIAVGVLVGAGYQLVGTYVVEPVVARLTTGALPDVSQFRSLIGNEAQLVFWLVVSWTLAAVLEELAYRGWILTRCA